MHILLTFGNKFQSCFCYIESSTMLYHAVKFGISSLGSFQVIEKPWWALKALPLRSQCPEKG